MVLMGKKETAQAKKEVKAFLKDYPNIELAGAHQDEDGVMKLMFKPKLAVLSPNDQPMQLNIPDEARAKLRASAGVTYKDMLLRSDLDLAKPDLNNEHPSKVYKRILGYARSMDVFGSYIDVKADLAVSGFENDCEDSTVKEFYDNWCQDVGLEQMLEWIYQEFFTSGLVRTYKIIGRYEPQVNRLRKMNSPPQPKAPKKAKGESEVDYKLQKEMWQQGSMLDYTPDAETKEEYAARKKRWSKGFVPIAYTVLNPLAIELVGPPDFNQTRVVLHPSPEMEELVKREEVSGVITDHEKDILDNMAPEIKAAIKAGKDVELDPEFVGAIDNRRRPYEKYAINPMVRAIEAVEYKQDLRQADYSTIDGITSEILVITVGDKDNPVLRTEDLQAVASLFNTAQKAFQVIWNHTLKVERVAMQNIDQILGAPKFEQAELDISGSMRVPRALLDGSVIGKTTKEAMALATKSLTSEIAFARRQVTRWLYEEYKAIADAYGFDRIPSIRWDNMILKDEMAMKTLIQGLVDRRIISYETAHKLLGFDPEFEKKMLTKEMPDVVDGKYGVIGSPYQKGASDGGGSSVKPKERTPTKSPSEGRPSGQPAPKSPAPAQPQNKVKHIIKKETKITEHKESMSSQEALDSILKSYSLEDMANMQQLLEKARVVKEKELYNLVNQEGDSDSTESGEIYETEGKDDQEV
jgi:hypothetical protein